MCGICGMFDLKNEQRIEPSVLETMTLTLSHRGPDDIRFFRKGNIGFGFTRLSIIDLEKGRQPLTNESGSVVMVCNGEIFNYKSLREKLIFKGHQFKTNTDIEVIIHLYEDLGMEFLNDLNGQFAFAIFDFDRNLLFCGRDQVGIAPFFYTIADNVFIFASEIKAILENPSVRKEVDLIGLDQILSFPGMISPRTLFKNIHCLENGHYLLLKDFRVHEKYEYWDLKYPKIDEIKYREDEQYYFERLTELITKAVKYRLQADVPVGFYLSGGLDSSLIASIINKTSPGGRKNTFSVCINDKVMSETKYQRMMANYINSIHHEVPFDPGDIVRRLPKVIFHSESVLKETYNTASLALSEKVKEQNVKVILTGEGADELFAGYVGYRFDSIRKSQEKESPPGSFEEDNVRERIWGDKDFFYEKDYFSFQKVKQHLYSNNINHIFDEINCLNYPVVNQERIKNIDIVHKRSYIDFKLRIPEHLLADHGDRMAFANSVEARYPFLDKELIEFTTVIPPYLKLKDFNEKYILKRIAASLVPSEIIKRPKFTFVAPGSPELLKQDPEYFNDLLSYERIKRQGYFNPESVESLKRQYSQKDFKLNLPYDNDLLIIIITFGMFLDIYKMPDLI